jgi:hypothetical protein
MIVRLMVRGGRATIGALKSPGKAGMGGRARRWLLMKPTTAQQDGAVCAAVA